MSAIVYLYHSISIDLESSRSYNSITLQAYTNGRRLVLVTVVWFWRRLSGSSNGRLVQVGRLVQGQSSGSGNGRLVLGRSLVLATVVWFWRRSSGSGDSRLVLATVVWFWRRSFTGCRSGASLSKEDVRKERWVKNKVGYIGGILGRAMCRGYR